MSKYYRGRRAQQYNAHWQTYSKKTLAEALATIDVPALREVSERLERSPRVLDVACGTGILLQRLLAQLPGIEAYGVDASEDMRAQARIALNPGLDFGREGAGFVRLNLACSPDVLTEAIDRIAAL